MIWLSLDHHDPHHAENDQRGKTRPNVIPIRAISKSRHGGGERIHSPDKTYSFLSKKYMWRMITKKKNCHKRSWWKFHSKMKIIIICSSVCGSSHLPWLCIRPSERVVDRWCHLKSISIKNILIMIENDQYWSKSFDNDKKWGQADCFTLAGHNQTIHVQCLSQFQPTTNKTTVRYCLRPCLFSMAFHNKPEFLLISDQ